MGKLPGFTKAGLKQSKLSVARAFLEKKKSLLNSPYRNTADHTIIGYISLGPLLWPSEHTIIPSWQEYLIVYLPPFIAPVSTEVPHVHNITQKYKQSFAYFAKRNWQLGRSSFTRELKWTLTSKDFSNTA